MEKRITCGKTLGVLALLLMGSVGSALADQTNAFFTFTGEVNPSVLWTGPNDSGGNETVYVSPYTATDGSTPLDIFCIDYNHSIEPPPTWYANVVNLDAGGTNDSLDTQYNGSSQVYYADSTSAPTLTNDSGDDTDSLALATTGGDSTAQQTEMYDRYLEAAYLFSLETNPTTGQLAAGVPAAEQTAIDVAVWTLFLGATPGSTGIPASEVTAFGNSINSTNGVYSGVYSNFANAVSDLLTCASESVTGGSTSFTGICAPIANFTGAGWSVVTPTPAEQTGSLPPQESLVYTPNTSVPEPQAILLFGTLVAILGASRYRRQKRA